MMDACNAFTDTVILLPCTMNIKYESSTSKEMLSSKHLALSHGTDGQDSVGNSGDVLVHEGTSAILVGLTEDMDILSDLYVSEM